eukprot:COSAG01_NODE_4102_length_5348_cov_5.912555_5_plen_115_part_00
MPPCTAHNGFSGSDLQLEAGGSAVLTLGYVNTSEATGMDVVRAAALQLGVRARGFSSLALMQSHAQSVADSDSEHVFFGVEMGPRVRSIDVTACLVGSSIPRWPRPRAPQLWSC